MAFATRKPMIFLLSKTEAPFIPNTAKRGYPLIDRELVAVDGYHTLASFCSYLAADFQSTLQLYLSIINSLRSIFLTLLIAFIIPIVLVTALVGNPRDGAPDGFIDALEEKGMSALAIGFVLLILCCYGAFFLNRYVVRKNVSEAIAGRRFDVRTLPHILQHSLNRDGLLRIKYNDILTRHGSGVEEASLIVKKNLGKLFLKIGWFITLLLPVMFLLYWSGEFPHQWMSILVFGICAVLILSELYLPIRCLITSGYIVVNEDGIVIPPAKHTIPWVRIAKLQRSKGILYISLNEPIERLEIDLNYYKIEPRDLQSIIEDGMRTRRD